MSARGYYPFKMGDFCKAAQTWGWELSFPYKYFGIPIGFIDIPRLWIYPIEIFIPDLQSLAVSPEIPNFLQGLIFRETICFLRIICLDYHFAPAGNEPGYKYGS